MQTIKIDELSYFYPKYKAIVKFYNEKAYMTFKEESLSRWGAEVVPQVNNAMNKSCLIPLHIDIFPTYKCNLRCKYCYAGTGDYKPRSLNTKQIDSLISGLVKTVRMKKLCQGSKKEIITEVFFAGGGEPTFDWGLFVYAVNEVKRQANIHDFIVNFGIVTNGMIRDSLKIKFICDNFKYIQVSHDGVPMVQDEHRPTVNGGISSVIVNNFIKKCLERKIVTAIRMTVSNFSVDYLSESIKYFASEYIGLSHVQIEPLAVNDKSERNCIKAPDPYRFSKNYFDILIIGKKLGINILSSVANIYTVRSSESFCDAILGSSIILNPDGLLSTCYEASTDVKELSNYFFVGNITKDGELQWTKSNKECQLSFIDNNCKECIGYEFCKGGCMASFLRNSDNRYYHCQITQYIFRMMIKEINENGDTNININLNTLKNPINEVENVKYWIENQNINKLKLIQL